MHFLFFSMNHQNKYLFTWMPALWFWNNPGLGIGCTALAFLSLKAGTQVSTNMTPASHGISNGLHHCLPHGSPPQQASAQPRLVHWKALAVGSGPTGFWTHGPGAALLQGLSVASVDSVLWCSACIMVQCHVSLLTHLVTGVQEYKSTRVQQYKSTRVQ